MRRGVWLRDCLWGRGTGLCRRGGRDNRLGRRFGRGWIGFYFRLDWGDRLGRGRGLLGLSGRGAQECCDRQELG